MATPVTLGAILKILQKDGTNIKDLMRKSPLMANTPHIQDFHSNTIDWSVSYSGLGGGSFTATVAEANDVNGEFRKFSVSTKSVYSYRTINGTLTRKALAGGMTTQYINALKAEMDLAQGGCFAKVATAAHRGSTGRVAVIATGGITSNTITVSNRSNIYLINKGDKIVLAETDGGSLRDSGDHATVVSRDPSAGTFTVDSIAAISGAAALDSIYIKGDNGGTSMLGLGALNPTTAPGGGDAVYGEDRSVDPEALAGVRFSTTNMSKATCMIQFMAYLQMTPGWDGSDGMIYCHGNDVADIQVALEGSRFISSDNEYGIGVSALRCGTAVFVTDPFAEQGVARWVPKGAKFELHTINGFVLDDSDGQKMSRAAGDVYVLRALCEGNFTAQYPGKLGVFSWPSS